MAAVDITSKLHSLPQVVKLVRRPHGLEALGVWVEALSWMHSDRPFQPCVTPAAIRELGASDHHADLLESVGLWDPVAEGNYDPRRNDHAGRPMWRVAPDPYRANIPRHIREAVFARDGYACQVCSGTNDLTLDHIFPWSLGGQDTVENLRVLCRPCNSRKGAKVL